MLLTLSVSICNDEISFPLSLSPTFALIVNTWNDFPSENETDVSAMPGQVLHAYYVLKNNGVRDDDITLMLYYPGISFIDFAGNGENALSKAVIDVQNEDINKTRVHEELVKLQTRVNETGSGLWIYLVGHGQYVDETTSFLTFENGEKLSGIEFADWIKGTRCENIVVLLDFCYSGGFAASLLQENNLTVVSSTDYCHVGWYYWDWSSQLSVSDRIVFGNCGSSFFHPFWKMVNQTFTLEKAFNYGKAMCIHWGDISKRSANITKNQNPQLQMPVPDMPEPKSPNTVAGFLMSIIGPLIAGGISILIAWSIYRKERTNYYKDRIFHLRGRLETNFRFMQHPPIFSEWEFLGAGCHLPREMYRLAEILSFCSMPTSTPWSMLGEEYPIRTELGDTIPPEIKGGIFLWALGVLSASEPNVSVNWTDNQVVYSPDINSMSDDELISWTKDYKSIMTILEWAWTINRLNILRFVDAFMRSPVSTNVAQLADIAPSEIIGIIEDFFRILFDNFKIINEIERCHRRTH